MRYKRPDNKNAISIVEASKRDMKFTLSLEPIEEAAPTIIRNIYESFRMLGDALLVSKGLESDNHIAPIKELTGLKIETKRPINLIDNLRRLRHNINYYGYKPNMEELKDTINISKSLFPTLLKKVQEEIDTSNQQPL